MKWSNDKSITYFAFLLVHTTYGWKIIENCKSFTNSGLLSGIREVLSYAQD